MSFQYMAQAIKAKGLTTTEKFLLLMICNYADSDGYCFPKIDTLASDCEIHKRTVIRNIDKLCEKGILKKTNRYKNKMQTSNLYKINIKNIGGGTESQRGGTESPKGVAQSHGGGGTESPKPINEPINKPNAHTRVKDFEKLKDHFEKMRGSPLSEVALAEALDKWDEVIKTVKPKNPADKFIELMDKSIKDMGSPPPSLKLFIHQKQNRL
jgi:hypothetical protein